LDTETLLATAAEIVEFEMLLITALQLAGSD